MKRVSIQEMRIDNIHFSYPDSSPLFHDLSFTFTKDHPIFIQGPSGVGKKTLFKILLGLNSIHKGSYYVNSKDVSSCDELGFTCYRLNMGSSFHDGGLINNKSIFENLLLPLRFHQSEWKQQHELVGHYLSLFKLEHTSSLRPALVNEGVRKTVNLLRAFILDPEVLFLDRPTLSLSDHSRLQLVQLIKDHHRHHSLKYLISISDDIDFINDVSGKVYELKSSHLELKDKFNPQDFFDQKGNER